MTDFYSYWAIAVVALVTYELLITMDEEIGLVWCRKFSFASFLVVAIRWGMILGILLLMVPPSLEKDCQTRLRLLGVSSLSSFALTALFSALRAFALAYDHRWLFFVTLALGLAPLVVDGYLYGSMTFTVGLVAQAKVACNGKRVISGRTDLLYTLASRIPVIVAEIIVVILTWHKTYKQYTMGIRFMSHLSACLFENGNVYFVFLLLLNVIKCVVPAQPILAPVTAFLDALPPIFVYRFILDIRRAALRSSHDTTFAAEFATDISTPVFAVSAQDTYEDGGRARSYQ